MSEHDDLTLLMRYAAGQCSAPEAAEVSRRLSESEDLRRIHEAVLELRTDFEAHWQEFVGGEPEETFAAPVFSLRAVLDKARGLALAVQSRIEESAAGFQLLPPFAGTAGPHLDVPISQSLAEAEALLSAGDPTSAIRALESAAVRADSLRSERSWNLVDRGQKFGTVRLVPQEGRGAVHLNASIADGYVLLVTDDETGSTVAFGFEEVEGISGVLAEFTVPSSAFLLELSRF